VAVDWAALLPAATARVELPTYAFDHHPYWLRTSDAATDAASLGQAEADHPLLGAVVQLPQSDGLVFTSRLSLRTHAWLADHRIGGVALVPSAALVELAVRAGDEAGCGELEELLIETPLALPEHGGVRVQVAVGAPAENGARTVEVYSLREDAAEGAGWTRHATGVLSSAPAPRATDFDFAAWPPAGARPVEAGDFYGELSGRGYGYGPAFQGVRALWRRGEELFAEVALTEEQRGGAGAYGLHPALLEAALHVETFGGADTPELRQPLDWNGLVLHAAGASALRVRLAPAGPGAVSVEAADETGGPVLTVDSLALRPVSVEQVGAAAGTAAATSLFEVEWTETAAAGGEPVSWAPVATADDVTALAADGAAAPAVAVLEAVGGSGSALELTSRVLGVVQAWLAGTGLEESRLVVATRGAVPAGESGAVTDPAGSAVWGLVRAAQAENPDRIVLLDTDPAAEDGPDPVLGAALACGEPQVAVRGTTLTVPRLTRAEGRATEAPAVFKPGGTVLITGGTGSLGSLAARRLVSVHGVRHLLLASRRGPQAEGVRELAAELTERGATVSVVACDVSDRAQAEALLASVPAEHPLTGIIHTAGLIDAGVIEALTPERLAGVFPPKVDAVRHLDELTRGLDLDAFVVYSSVSAVFMGAGSGSYAAANAFLDGLMAHRRAAGLPGLSLAWGLWDQTDGMAANTDDLTRNRMNRRGGLRAMTPAEGMELFDASIGAGQALLVPARLDLRAVRADAAAGGGVPHMLRGLVKAGRQQAHTAAAADEGRQLHDRLAALPAPERKKLLLDLVRTQVAAVLGHSGPERVRTDLAFKDAGFDSLTAVELRNRLRDATGLKLPATLVFDYPSPQTLAAHLHDALLPESGDAGAPDVDEARLRHALASVPLARFREAGLMDALVGLIAQADGAPEIGGIDTADEERAIAELDVDDLVHLALGE
ncbi:type I polyketide synthase, partial [Streptomyces racemochromogenes]